MQAMEEEQASSTFTSQKKPKRAAAAAAFSAKKKVVELHQATGIVGRIVEKGFSPSGEPRQMLSPAPFTQPTVLPFPVARHRSHGPHWAPVGSETLSDGRGIEDDADYNPISSFANPIGRREKKDLNFSRWREFFSGDGFAVPQSMKKEAKTNTQIEGKKNFSPTTASPSTDMLVCSDARSKVLETNGRGFPSPVDDIDAENRARLEQMPPDKIMEAQAEITGKMDPAILEMLRRPGPDKLGSKKGTFQVPDKGREGGKSSETVAARAEQKNSHIYAEDEALESDERGSRSLMDDIDAENLARLNQMSPDEIAEAQAEITGKIDPHLIEMLKKRQRDKLGKKKGPSPNRDKLGEKRGPSPNQDRERESRTSQLVEGGKSSKTVASLEDTLSCAEPNSSSWKDWSDRVEKVRALRFSLEGNVLEINSTQEQPNGNSSDCSQYNVENVAERDFLRTEGNPAAAGYTIKEAVELIRSMVPGQRSLALQILASVFNKASHNLQKKDIGFIEGKTSPNDKLVDWQAVWAFALGPETEMALSLRIGLDDNHDSVVLACAKVIQSVLCCDINEDFFDNKEKLPTHGKGICTAPVFRSKPEVDDGFLHSGFWKYNTKPSNIVFGNDVDEDDEEEGKHTIQDDVVVAGQDLAAGLVRMGILPRICYLLEMDPLPTLEECLVSLLIAFARHSPTCANAIMRCPRLIQTVIKMLTKQGTVEIHPSQIKAVVLLKVLSQSNKQICVDFVNRGVFQAAMWHWYKNAFTLNDWIKSGREHCKFTSAMMVEQLRLWKVCIHYGCCITYFADLFPAMCLWLNPPAFDKLIDNNVLREFASVAREAYLILEALAQRLPSLRSSEQLDEQSTSFPDDNMEVWSWSLVVPMVDLAINWLLLKNIPFVSSVIGRENGSTNRAQDSSASCTLWVISAVLHMLCTIFDRIAPENMCNSHLPWFVRKVGLEIVKIGFPTDCGSLVEGLCNMRHQNDCDASLSSVSCLHGLIRLAFLVDNCIKRARNVNSIQPLKRYGSETEDKILEEGIIKSAQNDLLRVLTAFVTLVSSEWHAVQSVEMFGRGGPAPGIGIGWGSSSGGFWSLIVLLVQRDAQLVLGLLEIFHIVLEKDLVFVEGSKPVIEGTTDAMAPTIINSILGICLIAGPGDRATLEKALDILLQAPVLKYLSFCMHSFFQSNKGIKSFDWQYKEDEYLFFGKILNSHFKNRWLGFKKKLASKKDGDGQSRASSRKSDALETIQEDREMSEMIDDCSSSQIEWAHQRLPLPVHWFLSAICSNGNMKGTSVHTSDNTLDVAKSGIFFLLGLEAISSPLCSDSQDSPISVVPLVWKLHALSMALHVSMDVVGEERSRNAFEALQELYGQQLDKLRCRDAQESCSLEVLNFKTQVHESYTTFIENIVEQFGAVSYGDIIYGRQVTIYLHRSAEVAVRLAAWNALSNAHALELLPPLENCIAEAEGYLEPAEHNEGILEACAKSWTSGGLDRAAARGSVSFTLALHHLSRFIFGDCPSGKLALRNKLAKSLLRSYSQKQHHQGMLSDLVRYKLPVLQDLQNTELQRRFELLKEACDGNSSLLAAMEKLTSSVQR